MEWEVSLSNGETWNRKQLYKESDISPFRRLLRYMKDGDLSITSFKIVLPSGFIHLPNLKGKLPSQEVEYFWVETYERFGGFFGGSLKSVERRDSVSFRVNNVRIYYWINDNNNVWCQALPINVKKEKYIEQAYVGTI